VQLLHVHERALLVRYVLYIVYRPPFLRISAVCLVWVVVTQLRYEPILSWLATVPTHLASRPPTSRLHSHKGSETAAGNGSSLRFDGIILIIEKGAALLLLERYHTSTCPTSLFSRGPGINKSAICVSPFSQATRIIPAACASLAR
jgi:hypothetical protein